MCLIEDLQQTDVRMNTRSLQRALVHVNTGRVCIVIPQSITWVYYKEMKDEDRRDGGGTLFMRSDSEIVLQLLHNHWHSLHGDQTHCPEGFHGYIIEGPSS